MPLPLLNIRRAVLACAVIAYLAICWWHPQWMTLLGMGLLGFWFIDTRAILAISDAHALGIDPNAKNPLDLFNQPNPYSDFWHLLRYLHVTRADFIWLGAALGAAFFIFVLLRAKPRSTAEILWSIAILCSPPVIFAFNRGNVDLAIFIVLSLVVNWVSSTRPLFRWLAVPLIVLATAMKFYPAVALVILLVPTRGRRETIGQIIAASALLAVFGYADAQSIARYAIAPRPSGFFTFGARVAPQILGWSQAPTTLVALLLALIPAGIWWRYAPSVEVAERRKPEHLEFILGAVVLTSCYFATINYLYRLICVIWIAPYLWTLCTRPEPAAGCERFVARATAALLLFALWYDAACCLVINTLWRPSVAQIETVTQWLSLAEQPLIAALVVLLLRPVVEFVRDGLRNLRAPTSDRG